MRSIIIYIPVFLLLCFVGCGFSTKSVDLMLNTASAQIDKAQKAGAEEFAPNEFNEAKSLLQDALSTPKGKQRAILSERANAKARLAEAIAKQVKSEKEAEKLESELKIIEDKAIKTRLEKQTVEEELKQLEQDDNK